eukprot:TRINITY_DN9445_c0_g1_i1.p1 TRINITY_DN9445_c0_g1~~TRINITY_DN9445_c0_g1_i1.p1  ORF type:complete len:180 (+),score=15.26 TRINITY_DN9445_c0_g1_i1:40-540(+)
MASRVAGTLPIRKTVRCGPTWHKLITHMWSMGPKESLRKLMKYNLIKVGDLVGTDELGNKYFENKEYMYGQHRWVEYHADDYDASHVTARWHPWLHYTNDRIPGSAEAEAYVPSFGRDHLVNQTGTDSAYHPHNWLLNREWEKAGSASEHDFAEFDPNAELLKARK